MIDEELVRLIRATIQDELRTARMKVPEFAGAGGNTVISSRGDIILTPGVGRHAYYQKDTGRTEIGSGGGGGGGGITGSGTTNYLPRFTGATAIGNSHLIDDGSTITSSEDIEMLATKTVYYNGLKTGEIFSKKTAVETVDYYGLQVTPYNTHGTNPGSFYIGDYLAEPAGNGIKITDAGISIYATGINKVYFANAEFNRFRFENLAVPPAYTDKGGAYLDTDNNNVYVNKGTYAVPDWQPLGGGVTDHGLLTGLSDDDHTQYLLASGARNMGGTLLPNASAAYNLGGVSNLWNVVWTKYIGGAEAQYDWIGFDTVSQIKMVLNSVTVCTFADAAITAAVDVVLGANKLRGTAGGGSDVIFGDDLSGLKAANTYADIKSIGTITPGSTGTKDLGSSSLFWNEIFAQIHYIEATTLKIDKNGSNMRFTIPSGGVYEFIVSA
jgi:hypothetical protein